jgi:ATP-dependent helicase/DNAse subunit B
MAEHVRNELARAGVPVRPTRVTTLAQFLEPLTPLAPAPEPVLHLFIEQALETLRLPSFSAVAQFPGFHSAVAELIEEVPASALGGAFGEELKRLFQEVEASLAACGMALRNDRLRSTGSAWPFPTVFDGFFGFSPAELDLIESLAAHSDVTLTLPDWPGAAAARQRLLTIGFTEHRLTQIHRAALRKMFSAPTLERETEEIARCILEHAARGRKFRDIGIILRARDPYAPVLETTLARFGIPARFYFTDPVASHPAVAYLSGLVQAILDGFDHASLLSLMRMPISGIGATPGGDKFDFALRKRIPGAGLPLRGVADVPEILSAFEPLGVWRSERRQPLDWTARLKTLHTLVPEPDKTDRVSWQQVQIWRSTAAALAAFETVLDDTAVALSAAGPITLAEFWRQAAIALSLEQLRVPDRRRDVVHVLDVYEARQWELPIVFVCGLTERHFPQYHPEDPLLNDAARSRAGLKTSAGRQSEESFLFDLAVTRSTEEVVLSYPRFNEKGEETLQSFFLQGEKAEQCETRVRPAPSRQPARIPQAPIEDLQLRGQIVQQHKSLAPTSIESFLQCPFQFFAGKTLRLRERPPAPRDRLDVLVQGSILHRALADLARMPLLGAAVFDQVFEDECQRARISPTSYRTEAVRLELLRHFEGFLNDRQVSLDWPSRVEEQFSFPLNALINIRGRIDRLDVGPRNHALVIDYKYSAGSKIREKIEENASGHLVQAGLYLLAAEKEFGLEPAGMLYCGLRKEVVWDGWHAPIQGLERIGEVRTRAALREIIDAAAAKAVEVSESIATGRIVVEPSNPDMCRWCDFRDICRLESKC